jgi:hypothetical protein
MPWITVDNATGNIYVVYFIAELAPANGIFTTSVYLAYSEDGGNTFFNQKVSNVNLNPIPFPIPPAGPFSEGYWGDYIGVDAYCGNVYVAWMSNAANPTLSYYDLYCSTVKVSTPVRVTSENNLDLNGPVEWGSPPNSPNSVSYDAYNTLTAAINQEKFHILTGANVSFKAGNCIHIKPGVNTLNDFGAMAGSNTHLYISLFDPCSVPFRRGSPSVKGKKEEAFNDAQLVVFPNPVKNSFEINYSILENERISIKLFDSFGRVVLDILEDSYLEIGLYNQKINLPDLHSGIYFVHFMSGAETTIRKVVKL